MRHRATGARFCLRHGFPSTSVGGLLRVCFSLWSAFTGQRIHSPTSNNNDLLIVVYTRCVCSCVSASSPYTVVFVLMAIQSIQNPCSCFPPPIDRDIHTCLVAAGHHNRGKYYSCAKRTQGNPRTECKVKYTVGVKIKSSARKKVNQDKNETKKRNDTKTQKMATIGQQ